MLTTQLFCGMIYNWYGAECAHATFPAGKYEKKGKNVKQTGFLWFSLHLNHAQKSLNKLKNKKMELYGLGSAHTICLCLLKKEPDGITKTDMAQRCGVDKAQISRVIAELEEKNYVSTSRNGSHYRQKYQLTEQGKAVSEEIQQTIDEINSYVSGSISEEDLETFYRTFGIICNNLKNAESEFLS